MLRSITLILLMLGLAVVVTHTRGARVVPKNLALSTFPDHIGEWWVVDKTLFDAPVLKVLRASDYLMRSYAETLMKDITSTSYTGQLRQFGDQITFQREPVARIHRYQKNLRLQTDTPEIETTTLTVDEGFYWNYKLDRVDVKRSATRTNCRTSSSPRVVARSATRRRNRSSPR